MTATEIDSRTTGSLQETVRHGIELWRLGQREAATDLLEAVLDGQYGLVDDHTTRKVLSRVLAFAASLSWPRTERLARRAVDRFPDHEFGWRFLGEALLWQGHFAEAETPLLKAIELKPESEDARLLLTMARRRLTTSEPTARPRAWPDRQHLFRDPRWLLKKYLLRSYEAQPFVRPDTVFMTLGSCFAENLARHLGAEGHGVHSEPIGEEVNSTYANRYLLNWIEHGPIDGPTQTIDEVLGPPRRERLRKGLAASDVLVLTLGVAPCFFDRDTGAFAFSALRSRTGHQYLAQQCIMRTTTVAENVANIHEMVGAAERIAGHPHQVVLTLSPVSLGGTTEFYSAVVADCLSKSTLRLACQEVIEQRPEIIYWPSFEIVRWLGVHLTRDDAPVFGAEDGNTRHVSNWLVELIVRLFLEQHAIAA